LSTHDKPARANTEAACGVLRCAQWSASAGQGLTQNGTLGIGSAPSCHGVLHSDNCGSEKQKCGERCDAGMIAASIFDWPVVHVRVTGDMARGLRTGFKTFARAPVRTGPSVADRGNRLDGLPCRVEVSPPSAARPIGARRVTRGTAVPPSQSIYRRPEGGQTGQPPRDCSVCPICRGTAGAPGEKERRSTGAALCRSI